MRNRLLWKKLRPRSQRLPLPRARAFRRMETVPEEDYSEELADYDDSEDDGPPWDEDDTESEDNE